MSEWKILKNFLGKNVRRMGQYTEQRQNRKSDGSRQRNKTGDSTVEWNDSPQIPDRVDTSDISSLLWGRGMGRGVRVCVHAVAARLKKNLIHLQLRDLLQMIVQTVLKVNHQSTKYWLTNSNEKCLFTKMCPVTRWLPCCYHGNHNSIYF